MSNQKRYEPDAAAVSSYKDSCKCFYQAKTMLEGLGSTSEEVSWLLYRFNTVL